MAKEETGQRVLAYVQRVIDGDTLAVITEDETGWTDMGMGQHVKTTVRQFQSVRLARIDAPERSTPAGPLSTVWVREQLVSFASVELEIIRRDKYGRLLAEVHYGNKNLSNELLASGMATVYSRSADSDDTPIQALPTMVGIIPRAW